MKAYKYFITATLALMLLGGCQDYNELVKNPNLPSSAPPSLLLTGKTIPGIVATHGIQDSGQEQRRGR